MKNYINTLVAISSDNTLYSNNILHAFSNNTLCNSNAGGVPSVTLHYAVGIRTIPKWNQLPLDIVHDDSLDSFKIYCINIKNN